MRTAKPQERPLPQFVVQYLEKKGMHLTTDLSRLRHVARPKGQVLKAVDVLVRTKAFDRSCRVYSDFVRTIWDTPSLMHQEFYQFIFPFFIHLAAQLFAVTDGEERAVQFIKFFRAIQPDPCQPIIDKLLQEKRAFEPPHFDIQITQLALDDLLFTIELKNFALLSIIMTRYINRIVAPCGHELLFVGVGGVMGNLSGKDILTPVKPVKRALSVMFCPGDPTRTPGILRGDDNKLFLTQALPDIAHFVTYNHRNRINDMKISKCGRLFGIAEGANVIVHRLNASSGVSVRNGQKTATLMSHSGRAMAMAFSHDSRFVVSGGMDCQLRVAHTEVFTPLAHFKIHTEPVLSVAWDDRARYFVGGSQDRTISMWSLKDPTCLRHFVGHRLAPTCLMFSRDGQYVVSCATDLTVRLWDVGTGCKAVKFGCGVSVPVALDVDPSNRRLVCGCEDGSVVLWDAQSGEHKWTSKSFEARVTDLKFTNDGTILLGSSLDGRVLAWNVANECAEPTIVMSCMANSSTVDSMTVTDLNLICTTGRSLRGDIVL